MLVNPAGSVGWNVPLLSGGWTTENDVEEVFSTELAFIPVPFPKVFSCLVCLSVQRMPDSVVCLYHCTGAPISGLSPLRGSFGYWACSATTVGEQRACLNA